MANTVTITVKVKNESQAGLAGISESVEKVSRAAGSAGDFLQGVFEKVNGPLGDMATKLITAGASSAALAAGTTAATGGINLLIGAVIAVAAAIPVAIGGFVLLAPAIYAIAGTAGAAATALVGLASSFAVLKIGFGGISDAFSAYGKQTGGAGTSAKKAAVDTHAAAERIRTASKQLRDAKEDEVNSARDVNRARQEEIDRLRELDLALRGQKISQKEAAQALVEAKEKARRANIAGSDWEKAEANNAVERAKLEYDSTSEKLGDLTAEKKKAVKDGVEGSDQVQNALEREKKAQERVQEAAHALAEAHRKVATAAGPSGAAGGVNAFSEAMAKLSPNAQKLVYALIDISKRFDVIKKDVEQHLFAGWDKSVTQLADKAFPYLNRMLDSSADHLNSLGKSWMKALGDDTFLKNIEKANGGFNKFIDHIKVSGSKFFDAFGRIAAASVPVLDKIGEIIERIATKFDNWIKSADNSGSLDTFMDNAAKTLDDIYDIGSLVFTIIGQIIEILFPGSQEASNGIFDSLKKSLQAVSNWLKDPKNKKQITDMISDIVGFFLWMNDTGIPIARSIAGGIAWVINKFTSLGNWTIDTYNKMKKFYRDVKSWMTEFANSVSQKWNSIKNSFNAVGDAIRNKWNSVVKSIKKAADFSGMWNGISNGFRSVINWIIDRWNTLSFRIPLGPEVGVNHINRFATGGIANGLSQINERGGEIVKLPNGSMVMPAGQSRQIMANAGGGKDVNLYLETGGNDLLDVIWEALAGRIRARGGNVQVALGRVGA